MHQHINCLEYLKSVAISRNIKYVIASGFWQIESHIPMQIKYQKEINRRRWCLELHLGMFDYMY